MRGMSDLRRLIFFALLALFSTGCQSDPVYHYFPDDIAVADEDVADRDETTPDPDENSDAAMPDALPIDADPIDADPIDDDPFDEPVAPDDDNAEPSSCVKNGECPPDANAPRYCEKMPGDCEGIGTCVTMPDACTDPGEQIVCGCDGLEYITPCEAAVAGTNVAFYSNCTP
jgi:hypothetical protein